MQLFIIIGVIADNDGLRYTYVEDVWSLFIFIFNKKKARGNPSFLFRNVRLLIMKLVFCCTLLKKSKL